MTAGGAGGAPEVLISLPSRDLASYNEKAAAAAAAGARFKNRPAAGKKTSIDATVFREFV